MISFKKVLPASYEISFIPLLLAYVFFGLGLAVNSYVALIGPLLYGLMSLFFVTVDLLDGISLKLFSAKLAFTSASLSPALLCVLLS